MKNKELFYFFGIADPMDFKGKLAANIPPLITTTQLLSVSPQPTTALNIADFFFTNSQFRNLKNLSDPGPTSWVSEFAGTIIHGVLLFASIRAPRADYFEYLDGISNPAVRIFTANQTPGQANISVLLGESGGSATRPTWAKEGLFLVFRQLSQFVPKLDKFLAKNPIGSGLLGADGRWKSGASVDLAPLLDGPVLGADPTRNNDLDFTHPDAVLATNQTSAQMPHIQKTRPWADLSTPADAVHHIMRDGIPYGPAAAVSADESSFNIPHHLD
ncbi:hypothetical protein K438DRAFT_1968006 [Mycena galopus ATCC 62051]|nr:hypothetical protein K438DRAFT_1968006 [Mycena galopus ATCC 62051]